MEPKDWVELAGSILASLAIMAGGARWLVKSYLSELIPNHGSSLKDSVIRLETRVDEIWKFLAEGNHHHG